MADLITLGQDTTSLMVNAFQRFAIAAEQIAATTKRLPKAAILGDYFAALSDQDLRIAARYFAGSPFPQFDQRVLQVGAAALMTVLLIVSGAEPDTLQAELVGRGDLGDMAGQCCRIELHRRCPWWRWKKPLQPWWKPEATNAKLR